MPTRELYLNRAVGFLSADLTSSGTTVTLANTAGFSATGNYMIVIDGEYMLVTAATIAAPGTLTVVRAQEGSTGVAHTAGSSVFAPVTAGSLGRLARQSKNGTSVSARREINFIEGSGITLTLADDGTNDRVDVTIAGSGGGGGGGDPDESSEVAPVLSDFTWYQQSTATATVIGNGIFLRAPVAAGAGIRGLEVTTPATPWSVIAKVRPAMFGSAGVGSPNCGMYFRASSGSPLIMVSFSTGNINLVKLNNSSSFNSIYASVAQDPSTHFNWIKLADDGTNRTVAFSTDGANWITAHSVGRTDFLTANTVGWYVEASNSFSDAGMKLLSWSVLNS